MDDREIPDKSVDGLVSIAEALPGMRIVSLPDGQSWVGALMFVKTQDNPGLSGGWSMRRTEGLSDEELLGIVGVGTEMLRDRIRSRNDGSARHD